MENKWRRYSMVEDSIKKKNNLIVIATSCLLKKQDDRLCSKCKKRHRLLIYRAQLGTVFCPGTDGDI